MDRLARMQQWAAGQYASQYGNNPWIQAMMRFMRGLKGNYGSSASGWGGGMVNAGQQAQAPAPKPPAQQQQQQQHGQPPGNSDGRLIGSPQSDNSIRPRPGIVRDPSAPGGDSVGYTMPAYTIGYVGKGKGNVDHLGHPQMNGDYGWIPLTPDDRIIWDSVQGSMQPQQQQQQQQHGQPPGNSDGRLIGSPQSDNSIRPRPGIVRDPSAPGGDSVGYTMPAYGFGYQQQQPQQQRNAGTSTQAPSSGGQISPGDDWWSRFAEEIGKLPITDKDHLGMPYKGGNGWDYSAMPAGRVSTSTKSAPTLGYPSGGSSYSPENVMRVTSMPGCTCNVYPQRVADYMMSHRSNSSGQGQGV